jgi:transcriptional regulator with XRE-family HTH domain
MAGNPLSRRVRLARELDKLRTAQGLKLADLAARSGVSASVINRLEKPAENLTRKTSLLAVRSLLAALGVERGSNLWNELDMCAEDGARTIWCDNVESGLPKTRQYPFGVAEYYADLIRDYGAALLPGPVQTADYARYRAQVGTDGEDVDVEAVVAGRIRRQRQILDAPTRYEVILEEQTVRRWPVPPDIMLDQLRHLLDLAQRPDVSVRMLRVDAQVANGCGAAPRTPYAIYTYPDPDDPKIVTVDTVTTDLLITKVSDVDGYAQVHERLRRAALSDADSAALIREVADKLAASV